MLATIAGKTHIVYTGVTLQNAARGWRDTRVAESEVRMLPLDERDIAWYVSTGEPRDKAGAYAVQGIGAHVHRLHPRQLHERSWITTCFAFPDAETGRSGSAEGSGE